MGAKILDGKTCSEQALELINKNLCDNDPPTLVIYRIGDDPASAVYVRNKVRAAERVGIRAIVHHFPADEPFFNVLHAIENEGRNPDIDGIMVQLPLPEGWDERKLIECIPPEKDVDGLTYANMGMLHEQVCFHQPCTAKGIIWLLHENGIHLTGKHVVVVGRSEIVGKPVALLALNNDATVTICHSRTKNLAEMTRQADILIVAVGKPGLITADMVKPGAVVVDVGINRNEEGKLVGDVDFDSVVEVAGWITPVPGGVGPMTVAMLMMNTYHAQGTNR
jgi:methylenetetrahydrofolate dehydrogenase (NADP+)/methenyltetrahydrofolate cyclohydrolase